MLVQPRSWLSPRDTRGSSGARLRLTAAHDEWNHVGIALAAIEQGYFAEEGLPDVELITFQENPELDALLERYFVTIPLRERNVILGQIMHHFTDQVVFMGLFYNMEP